MEAACSFTVARNNLVFAQHSSSRISGEAFFTRDMIQATVKYNVTKGESSCTIVPLSSGSITNRF